MTYPADFLKSGTMGDLLHKIRIKEKRSGRIDHTEKVSWTWK